MRAELSKVTSHELEMNSTSGGWIARVRMAVGITQTTLARRLGVSKQAVSAMEDREKRGSITISHLRQVAEAMGCQLEYRFVPMQNLNDYVYQHAESKARKQLSRLNRSFELEDQAFEHGDFESLVRDRATEYIDKNDQSIWDEV